MDESGAAGLGDLMQAMTSVLGGGGASGRVVKTECGPFKTGDKVKVVDAHPQYGLGSVVPHLSVGTIRGFDKDNDAVIDFGFKRDWVGQLGEIEICSAEEIAEHERRAGSSSGAQDTPHTIHIRYRNNRTGEEGGAQVTTNDDRAVSNDASDIAAWLANIQGKKAREEGWAIEDTHVEIAEPPLSSRTEIHVAYRNTKMGESGRFSISTIDPRAASEDQAKQAAWLQIIRRDHAREQGWAVEDTHVEITDVMTINRRDAVVTDLLQKKKKVPTDSL